MVLLKNFASEHPRNTLPNSPGQTNDFALFLQKIDDLKEVVREREDIIHQLQGEIHRKDEIIKNLLKHSTMSEEENMRIMSQVHEKDYRETYRKKHHQEKDLTREAIEKERVAKRQRELVSDFLRPVFEDRLGLVGRDEHGSTKGLGWV